jgi:hypothetical protein
MSITFKAVEGAGQQIDDMLATINRGDSFVRRAPEPREQNVWYGHIEPVRFAALRSGWNSATMRHWLDAPNCMPQSQAKSSAPLGWHKSGQPRARARL